ncbi:GtrA family protein [uncultured Roseobacter sp.]|uniref:GtrA family protein n=1 Tax=uncultured Roseobacter sp. TaxID=114847 RepID=UPI0026041349|nr:GtrA family protein [uncultured Roseobacter sp.]
MHVVRFALIGGLVALTYFLLYLAFLQLGMARGVANGLAFLLAICLQYVGQAGFTFGRRLDDPQQVLRFVVMVGTGLVVSGLITGVIFPALGIADWIAAATVTVVLPVQNYVFMTVWVFASRPRAERNLS